jgi:hypothetical protein
MDPIAVAVAAVAPQSLSLLTRLERQQMDRWPFQSSSRFIEKRLIDRRDALLLAMVGSSRFLQRRLRYLPPSRQAPQNNSTCRLLWSLVRRRGMQRAFGRT